jgi:hypothetical protein
MTQERLFTADLVATKRRQPSKAAKRRVAKAFDADALARICTAEDFSRYARRFDLAPGRYGQDRFYYYQDNGSPILAVAHLDTVQDNGACTVTQTAAGLLACSGALDDRLGAYVILELLPRLGIVCDWLLTTDEEIGRSTAADFAGLDDDKEYNWMIQFDRGGTDVVAYQYDSPELVELVEESGARVDIGSYSDICELDDLGCVGLNWGVGYQDYHSARSHAWLDDTFRMVARFEKFHRANADKHLAYDPFHAYDPFDWDKVDDEAQWVVAECGHEVNVNNDATYVLQHGVYVVCHNCGTADDAVA